MNTIKLNTIGTPCKAGGGGNSGGGNGGGSTPSRPKWTGHADAEGLKAIGWTDEDIAYYQENGVNWNAEDDEYHKVSEDNKALYGVLTANNISTYKDRIVYLPKIDTSGKTDITFDSCYSMAAVPMLDTSNMIIMSNMFKDCFSLVTIPEFDTRNVQFMNNMFNNCKSLTYVPMLNTSKVTTMNYMFSGCTSLTNIPQLDTSNVKFMREMCSYCGSLTSFSRFDTRNVTNMQDIFMYCYCIKAVELESIANSLDDMNNCYALQHLYLKNLKVSLGLSFSNSLSKDSLLYIINNEASTSAITIQLSISAYNRLASDTDIVASLAAHPNISLSK